MRQASIALINYSTLGMCPNLDVFWDCSTNIDVSSASYTILAVLLTKLLHKGQPKNLPLFEEHKIWALAKLVQAISSKPELVQTHQDLPFVIDMEASDNQIVAAPSQTYMEVEQKKVLLWSRSFNSHERIARY